MTDFGEKSEKTPNFKAIDVKDGPSVAVAVKDEGSKGGNPKILAAARGALADQLVNLAFEHDIKIREDGDLANILAELELDSPVPTEALMAVAEILSYVCRANGEPDPFNAILAAEEDGDL